MTDDSPTFGTNCSQKQNSSNKSKNCDNKNRKTENEMSLLFMWKIESSQKSSTESTEDDIFLPSKNFKTTPKKVKASPKKPKVLPKPSVKKINNPESNASKKDDGILEYCPNCQMPFSALIKQSQNWHLTECMDFDFQYLKECPAGELCSSTIPSHYMKYTHYGLAKFRSGIPQTPTNNPLSEKFHCSNNSGKIKSETLTPPFKPKKSFPKQEDSSLSQNTSHSMSNQQNFISSCSNPKDTDPSKFSLWGNSCSSVSSNKTEEKCKQSGVCSEQRSSNQSLGVHNGTTISGDVAKSTSDCGESSPRFKIPDSVASKTVSPAKIGSLKVEKNQNRVLQPKHSKRMLSPMDEELIFSKMSGDFASAQLPPVFSDDDKEVISGVQRNIKRIKLNDSSLSSNNFLSSDDSLNASETEVFSKGFDSKICSQGSASGRNSQDLVCSKPPNSNDANINGSHQDRADTYSLANDWFPLDELNTGDASNRNSDIEDDSEEELFSKDASDVIRKTMVQSVITKTSSTSDSSFNITLSPVKPERLAPQKKIKNPSQPRNPHTSAKTEPLVSPRKKQTSLMSFFKSSNPRAESTQQVTFVEPPSTVNNKSNQNKWGKVFQERKTFNVEQNNSIQQGRRCPFYKKIPGTTFAVDAFSYGNIPGIKHYFLSHFHYDHYGGLTKNFQHPVYCTVVTANLITLKIRLPQKYIHTLPLNETTLIENVAVTVLDANHCPGSVMFLFEFPDGRFMLHTGDFRATPAMELHPSLKSCRLERLFLDTTYCKPLYDFPSQESVLDMLTSLVVPRMKSNAKLLVVCGSYLIGKEKAFMAIAESVDCKIWADPSKRNVLKCLEDQRISSRLVTTGSQAKIHVRPMQMIKISLLREYLSKYSGIFNEIIGLKPTGWEHTSHGSNTVFSLKPISQGPVTIYGVPYSEHCSFSELKKFVQFLKPKCITPTVNVGNAQYRNQMESYFKQWLM